MKQTKLIIAGGFLGAGKTTLIWEAAKRLMKEGKRVGLVTNDQAPELVDTKLLRQTGLNVEEVAGSCFCCNFNGFVDAIRNLRNNTEADVIIAEPVGSCADLSATIINPLKQYHSTEVIMSPFTVLADPSRLKDILYGGNGGLHEDAAYIYRKQLEEADVILITKIDTLTEEQINKIKADAHIAFPSATILAASAANGTGVDEWLKDVGGRTDSGSRLLNIDYDKYAHGEAVLGWLNGTIALEGDNADWDAMLEEIMNTLSAKFKKKKLRVGHVKVIMENGKTYAVGNIANAENTVTLRGAAGCSNNARLIVNARVETSPENLDEIVKMALMQCFGNCKDEVIAWRYLQPGRPNPTHRMDSVV